MESDTILWLQRPIGEETRPISVTIFVNYFAEQQGGNDAHTMTWGEMVSVGKREGADIIHEKRVFFRHVTFVRRGIHIRQDKKY